MGHFLGFYIFIFLIALFTMRSFGSNNTLRSCDKLDIFLLKYDKHKCYPSQYQTENSNCNKGSPVIAETNQNDIYIMYDINPGEGFNLRRDVYVRLAVFLKKLKQFEKYRTARLVLPPYPHLYHWKSRDLKQYQIFWNHFFDLKSLQSYTDVLDIWEFFDHIKKSQSGRIEIDGVYRLKHFEEMFENGVFVEKYELEPGCINENESGPYFGYSNLTTKNFSCLKFQGSSVRLKGFLDEIVPDKRTKPFIILFLNAETVLHDHWGNGDYWRARRSMRFNNKLVDISNKFRISKFNSTNELDLVQRPKRWQDEKSYRKAIGGNYLCAHLRRADFLYGREKTTPTLLSAARQIKEQLKKLNLQKVFISSDCSKTEYKDLKHNLVRYKVVRYSPESHEDKQRLKDGGIAIIDQIICSHAKYFIGTYESTFTYRIYEEREILGFRKNMTFNTFCKLESDKNCEKNSVWPIVYD